MEEADVSDRRVFGGALGVSLLLHGLAALMLIGEVEGHIAEPLKDVVEVELVAPMPENTQPAEPLPPEQPEAPPEEPQTEEPAPPPPQTPAEAAETPADVPVLQPVEEFGEEDTGPQETAEETPPEQVDPLQETPEEPEEADLETAPAEAQTEATEANTVEPDASDIPEEAVVEDPGSAEEPLETDAPETDDPETDTPETDTPEPEASEADVTETEKSTEPASGTEAETVLGIAEEETNADFGIVGPIATDQVPKRKPASPARAARQQAPSAPASPPAGMLAARQLYSRDILDAPQARTAMRGMSEGQRLNLLCMTELRAQIASVSALPPELLPRFRPPPGNVLQPKTAAFRSLGRWFDVSFRCETDGGVTRVENFAFKIGREIPQSQWLERGLTGF